MPQSHTALSHMPAPDRHAGPTDYPSQTAASASVGARRAARTAG
ncbi:hypothetical protein PSN01_00403 [Micromonospora saelicesensis]|nr:hypothetical protein PSN01_00403 [Micromonospora saelicesensis]